MSETKTVYILTDVYGDFKFATLDLNTAEIWESENSGQVYYEVDLI